MATMDAQAIYDNFHTHAQGTPGLAAAQQTAEQLAAKYQDRAVATQQLIDGVQTGWKGAASEAAAQGLTPLAVSSLDTHQQLTSGQDIVGRQVDSFHTAVSEVQPVPPAPTMQNVITAAVTGQDTTPMIDQMAHSYATQAANVDAYSKYVSASQYNTSNLPPITSVDTTNAPVSAVTPPPASASTSSGTAHAPRVSSGSATRTSITRAMTTGTSGSGNRSSLPPTSSGGSTPPASSNGNGSTTTSSAPSPVLPPPSQSSQPGPSGPPVSSGGQPTGPVVPVGGSGPSDGDPWPGGSGPVSGVPGDGGAGTGTGLRGGVGAIDEEIGGLGIRPGAGASGLRGLASGPNTAAGAGSGEEGLGGRSGTGSGSPGVAEEEALSAEQGAASRGVTSTSAAPMGAGRSGRSGEDSEHQRKYGVEEDGEELFGFSGRLAPPVLGETPTEREQRHEDEAGRHRHEE